MAAFEKTKSGIPMMDEALNYIRLGDNVVWQVPSLNEFRFLAERFANQAIADGRNLIYIRFAGHEPILTPRPGLRIEQVELSHRFETFTVNIHNLIEREGYDAFYVFDCLSELEEAWATDLMMGNFFHLTCPYLFILDTVAFFPIIRGRHSFDAIATIRDTTQLFLDVYTDADEFYVRPMKVWNRYSQTMFQPHRLGKEDLSFKVLSDGTDISHFYSIMNKATTQAADQNLDSWERFFKRIQLLMENGIDVTSECARICDIMLTRDERMRELIKENFKPEDYFEVHSRMVGTGMIGG
ncbi:MAG: phosphoenolpyruvate synthase, partial [Firmicutes bacterium]|nr:phosphoenolpyruvate synthase [Bacillota bacterium]